MDYKEQIQIVLKSLESIGFTRGTIEEQVGASPNWIDQVLARGGNKQALKRLKTFEMAAIAKSNREVSTVNEPVQHYATITIPVAERIDELKNDKRVLQETIASNLQTIHASQDLLMVLMRSVYDQTTEIKQLLAAPQIPDKGNKEDLVLTKPAKGRSN
jgi:hypothetical protein